MTNEQDCMNEYKGCHNDHLYCMGKCTHCGGITVSDNQRGVNGRAVSKWGLIRK